MSKSATKASIEPGRARRIVDIPRFSSRPIPARSAFVADLDTLPPRVTTGAPPAPHRHPRITFLRPPWEPQAPQPTPTHPHHYDDPGPRAAVSGEKDSIFVVDVDIGAGADGGLFRKRHENLPRVVSSCSVAPRGRERDENTENETFSLSATPLSSATPFYPLLYEKKERSRG